MKFLKVQVVKKSHTDVYIEVPDDFEPRDIMHHKYREQIGKIAEETTQTYDWDEYGWEEDVDVEAASVVEESEAKEHQCGKLESK